LTPLHTTSYHHSFPIQTTTPISISDSIQTTFYHSWHCFCFRYHLQDSPSIITPFCFFVLLRQPRWGRRRRRWWRWRYASYIASPISQRSFCVGFSTSLHLSSPVMFCCNLSSVSVLASSLSASVVLFQFCFNCSLIQFCFSFPVLFCSVRAKITNTKTNPLTTLVRFSPSNPCTLLCISTSVDQPLQQAFYPFDIATTHSTTSTVHPTNIACLFTSSELHFDVTATFLFYNSANLEHTHRTRLCLHTFNKHSRLSKLRQAFSLRHRSSHTHDTTTNCNTATPLSLQ
jgi:hypothetical protein